MRFSPAQYRLYKAEVVADPDTRGYATVIAAFPQWTVPLTQEAYDALPNQAAKDAYDAGIAAWEAAVVAQLGPWEALFQDALPAPDRETITNTELLELIDEADFEAAGAGEKQRVAILLSMDTISVSAGSKGRAWLVAAFNGTGTATALIAAIQGLTQKRHEALGFPLPGPGQLERIVREVQ